MTVAVAKNSVVVSWNQGRNYLQMSKSSSITNKKKTTNFVSLPGDSRETRVGRCRDTVSQGTLSLPSHGRYVRRISRSYLSRHSLELSNIIISNISLDTYVVQSVSGGRLLKCPIVQTKLSYKLRRGGTCQFNTRNSRIRWSWIERQMRVIAGRQPVPIHRMNDDHSWSRWSLIPESPPLEAAGCQLCGSPQSCSSE